MLLDRSHCVLARYVAEGSAGLTSQPDEWGVFAERDAGVLTTRNCLRRPSSALFERRSLGWPRLASAVYRHVHAATFSRERDVPAANHEGHGTGAAVGRLGRFKNLAERRAQRPPVRLVED
jgi:hypothetical protein